MHLMSVRVDRFLRFVSILALAACGSSGATPSDGGAVDASTQNDAQSGGQPDGAGGDEGPETSTEAAGHDAAPETEGAAPAETGGGDAADEAGAACTGVFCEDFETGKVDPAKWTTKIAGEATVTIQQQIVAHGRYAAQFHSPDPQMGSPQDYVYIIASNAGPGLTVNNFGRAYFYTNPKPVSQDTGLIFGGTAGFPSPNYMSVASNGSGWQFGYIQLMSSPQGEVQSYPTAHMPVATWMCLEWEFNDQPDTINVWGDGQLIGTLDNNDIDYPSGHAAGAPLYNGKNSGLIGSFVDFGFGFYDWHPGTVGFNVYYDDIVLDTKRVGCLSGADQ